MTDFRQPGGPRQEYFDYLYAVNLEHKIMPGLVYLYLPFLRERLGWDRETCLWFAFLNGMTQNPLTSLRLLRELPEPPQTPQALTVFGQWFNASWVSLQFDTDRRYAKKDTMAAIKSYCRLLHSEHVDENATDKQSYLYDADGGEWENLWDMVTRELRSFGRLSAWSYLEYVHICGSGLEPDTLLFQDRSGSRSHRNGMLFLTDNDELVDDKRTGRGPVKYENFTKMCSWLEEQAKDKLVQHSLLPHANYFTFESQLCTFKNSFFGRRYPGVYADMAWERLEWYKTNVNEDTNYKLIREAYATLPAWLQRGNDGLTIKQRAAIFPSTGLPYRAEHFLA